MVNDRFLRAAFYDFERLDARAACSTPQANHRKPKTCGRGTARRFFWPNAPQIKLTAITWALSKVLKAPRALRAGIAKRSTTSGRDARTTGVATMFFLLRMAFWLGLVLVLLPRDKTPESQKLPQISVSDAVTAASAAVSDMSQFCKRQPQACEVGGQAATVIGVRAQEGARKIYQTITDKPENKIENKTDRKPEADKKSPDHTGSIGGEGIDIVQPDAPRDTLTPDDLAVEWRGLP